MWGVGHAVNNTHPFFIFIKFKSTAYYVAPTSDIWWYYKEKVAEVATMKKVTDFLGNNM